MTQKKLTALGIATLPARHRPYPDPVVAGLGLRIGTNRKHLVSALPGRRKEIEPGARLSPGHEPRRSARGRP